MDVAFICQFMGDKMIFRHVDSKLGKSPIKAGESMSLGNGYCKRVVEGRLPELIPDTSAIPEAMAIPETREIPIGCHIGVPVCLSGGALYGTVCCFSHTADSSLDRNDLDLMKALAALLSCQITTNSDYFQAGVGQARLLRPILGEWDFGDVLSADGLTFQLECELLPHESDTQS